MARPLKIIDWGLFDTLAGLHCTKDEITEALGVDDRTLDRAVKREKKLGFDAYYKTKTGRGKMSLRRMQWRAAEKGNPAMLIWLGKQLLGQVDKQVHEGGDPDKPMNVRITIGEPTNDDRPADQPKAV
jgi:ribosomal protein L34